MDDRLLEGLRKMLGRADDADAEAAVVIILSGDPGNLKTLLVKRACSPSDPWSGDIALPGGKRQRSDASLLETVTRETLEETGLDLARCQILGSLRVTTSNVRSGMTVLPFVAFCEEEPAIRLSEELTAHFWVPLEGMQQSRCTARVRGIEVPAFTVEGEVVWGLTYRIVERLLEILAKAK